MVLEQAIADDKMRDCLVTYFNDEDPEHIKSLQSEIDKLAGIETLKYKAQVSTGNVGDLQGAIKDWGSDCVFFFNYNRINAGISNDLVDKHMKALFGEKRAEALKVSVKDKEPAEREALVLENLADAIKELGGKYVLPFRFRNEKGTRSTHHLVFVSKHVRGYEIMKDIMAKESSTRDQNVPSLEYSPAAANTPLLFSLSRPFDGLVEELPIKFAGQKLSMIKIFDDHHVDTPFIKKNYKDALCKLESEGRISAEPSKRKPGTFADAVVVTFPTLKGST